MNPPAAFSLLTHHADFGDPIEPRPSASEGAVIRSRAGVSRELLAVVLGVGVCTLERLETGETHTSRRITGDTAERYYRVLGFLARITESAEASLVGAGR